MPQLANYIFAIISFDLWISKGHMIYLLLSLISLDFIDNLDKWLLIYFEATKIINQALANNLTKLINQYGLKINSIPMLKVMDQIWIMWQLHKNLLWGAKF